MERRPKDPALGRRMRTRREALGLTQDQLAQRVNVKASAISKYEAGRPPSEPRTLVNLARSLGARLEWLLTGEEPIPAESAARESGRRPGRPVAGRDLQGHVGLLADIRTTMEDLVTRVRSLEERLRAGSLTTTSDQLPGRSKRRPSTRRKSANQGRAT